MGDFRRGGFGGNRGGGFKKFGGRPSFGGNRGGDRGGFGGRRDEKFSAICAKCNKECEVPFRPNGRKPVLCNECFGSNSEKSFGQRDNNFRKPEFNKSERPNFNSNNDRKIEELSRSIEIISSKLDKIMELIAPQEIAVEEIEVDEPVTEKKEVKATKEAKPKKVAKKKSAKK